MPLVFSALLLVVLIAALADIITADQWRIRHLDKVFWIIIVILLPLVGSILWFTVGRDYSSPVNPGGVAERPRELPAPALGNTEQELAALEREIAADRIRQLEEELRRKRKRNVTGAED